MNTCHHVTLYRHTKFYFSHSIIFFMMLCINWNFFIPSLDVQMLLIKSSYFFWQNNIFLLSKLPSYSKRLQTFHIKAIFQSLNFRFASFFSWKEIKSSRHEQFMNGKSFFFSYLSLFNFNDGASCDLLWQDLVNFNKHF